MSVVKHSRKSDNLLLLHTNHQKVSQTFLNRWPRARQSHRDEPDHLRSVTLKRRHFETSLRTVVSETWLQIFVRGLCHLFFFFHRICCCYYSLLLLFWCARVREREWV